jgi:hypothetical protein
MMRTVVLGVLAFAAYLCATAATNYVTQARVAQIGVRRCAETPDSDMCMDILDLRTLQTITIRLPKPDRGV